MTTTDNQLIGVEHLAAMSPTEYDRVREVEAKKRNARVTTLDKEVATMRRSLVCRESSMVVDIEPWSEPVKGAELLDTIYATIKRHIVCEDEIAQAATLWITFTWFIDYVQVAPLAIITAPEKRCGKTQLLEIISKLSRRPLLTSNISPAAIFRVIEAHSPTLIIDEADSFLKDNEQARGILNSGHTRQTAYVIRTVGEDHEPQRFSTWGAKAICGIGSQAETLMDRAIDLELRRKLVTEDVESQRRADPKIFKRLSSMLARYAIDYGDVVEHVPPDLPAELNDRAQDNWEPLLAIADCAGPEWATKARQAALKISGKSEETVSIPSELLADIQDIFEGNSHIGKYPLGELLKELIKDDLKAWSTYNRGKPLTPRQLRNRLKDYGIKTKDIREGNRVLKGYDAKQFKDVFKRYLSSPLPEKSATTLQNTETPMNTGLSDVASIPECSATEKPSATANSLANKDCSVEAFIAAAPETEGVFESKFDFDE